MVVREMLTVESSNLSFIDNTVANFKTRLPKDLHLDVEHVMAVVDISIPNTVFNIRRGNYVTVKVSKHSKNTAKRTKYEPGDPGSDISNRIFDNSVRSARSTKPLSRPNPLLHTHPDPLYASSTLTVSIPPGFYPDIDQVLEEFRNVVEATLKLKNTEKLHIVDGCWYANDPTAKCEKPEVKKDYIRAAVAKIVFHKRRGTIAFNPDYDIIMEGVTSSFTFSKDIANLFGYPAVGPYTVSFSPGEKNTVLAPYMSRVHPVETLYLYCHQVKSTIVSDREVQILRCIPFGSQKLELGALYVQEFKNKLFVDIPTSHLHVLSFELRDSAGQPVDFESGSKPVRLTLKIKPKNRQ